MPSNYELWQSFSEETKQRIRKMHQCAYTVCEWIDEAVADKDWHTVDSLKDILECLEYGMQGEWGFKKDPNKHTWWLKSSSCKCPKLDNLDPAYYGGGKIIAEDCPIHGKRK